MKVLLIAGHGAGDPGAVSGRYREAEETRRVAAALGQRLGCDIYPTDRNAYYDYRDGTLQATARFQDYDFVLELHFNAFRAGGADGRTKGVEAYVPKGGDKAVADKLCKAVAGCGLTNRGVKEGNYAVIGAAKGCGTPACLLEVCFLDDPDDMRLYAQRFGQMIAAMAGAIMPAAAVYQTAEDVPAWGRATVEKLVRKGYLRGGGAGLELEPNLLRMLVVNDRAGLYDD